MSLGLYISVPFCRTKCSYCNFASGVFSRDLFTRYLDRLCFDVAHAPRTVAELDGQFERAIDSMYLGGGTPTMLSPAELERLFGLIRETFELQQGAEVTVECAPGLLAPDVLDALLRCGVNRVSLGVQSFVDGEAAAVGRLHSRGVALDDIARLRAAGIGNINVDLIAGLPHQTAASWRQSLDEVITAAVPHVSVYMLEVDEDSRLGRELIAGGTRYHAHFVPDEDATADFYLEACERLDTAGICQYEISNFAWPGCESRHNLKYWTRQPYLGFGVDAHSMIHHVGAPSKPGFGLGGDVVSTERQPISGVIPSEDRAVGDRPGFGRAHARSESRDPLLTRVSPKSAPELGAADDTHQRGREPGRPVDLRFSTPDSLDIYLAGAPLTVTPVSRTAALEEAFFLGLRLTRGIDLQDIAAEFGEGVVNTFAGTISQLCESRLLEREGTHVRLTPRGRLLSNEVFQRFLSDPAEN